MTYEQMVASYDKYSHSQRVAIFAQSHQALIDYIDAHRSIVPSGDGWDFVCSLIGAVAYVNYNDGYRNFSAMADFLTDALMENAGYGKKHDVALRMQFYANGPYCKLRGDGFLAVFEKLPDDMIACVCSVWALLMKADGIITDGEKALLTNNL